MKHEADYGRWAYMVDLPGQDSPASFGADRVEVVDGALVLGGHIAYNEVDETADPFDKDAYVKNRVVEAEALPTVVFAPGEWKAVFLASATTGKALAADYWAGHNGPEGD